MDGAWRSVWRSALHGLTVLGNSSSMTPLYFGPRPYHLYAKVDFG